MEQIWNKDSIQIRNSEVCSGARPQELSARSFYISRVKGHPAITTPLQMISAKTAFETEIFHKYHTNIEEKIIQISNQYHTNIKRLSYVSSPVNGWPSITTHLQMISAKTAFEWMAQKYFTNIIQIS